MSDYESYKLNKLNGLNELFIPALLRTDILQESQRERGLTMPPKQEV